MNRSAVVVVALTAMAILPVAATECAAADELLSRGSFTDWRASHAYFVRFKGRCSDGALAEALSSRHTELLARTAPNLGPLRALAATDPAYLNWLLLGVFYDPEEMTPSSGTVACRILKRLRSCAPTERELCTKLAARVGPSPAYVQACAQ